MARDYGRWRHLTKFRGIFVGKTNRRLALILKGEMDEEVERTKADGPLNFYSI